MSLRQKSKRERGFSDVGEKVVVVAVRAAKEILRTPLVWALTNVVVPGDCIKLLVVIPAHGSGRKLWGFSRFTSECTNGPWRPYSGTISDQKDDLTDLCSQMMCQLHDVYDPDKIKIRVKVVSGSTHGVVAAEARKAESNWVILDRHLKQERKCCMQELQCNVVVMKGSQPKVLRLNLVLPPTFESEVAGPLSFDLEAFEDHKNKFDTVHAIRGPPVTPISSPDHGPSLTATDVGTYSISSSDPGTSPFLLPGIYGDPKVFSYINEEKRYTDESDYDTDSDKLSSPSIRSYFQPWLDDVLSSCSETPHNGALISTSEALLKNLSNIGQEPQFKVQSSLDFKVRKSVREVISLSRNALSASPPLCSICQHKTPMFGKPPKWFTFAELELATSGFAQINFLAEGGYGSVYRGVLPDGQVVAVKQHKLASSQGDSEFCSEVEVLSCAQHRNVVMLIGLCVEAGRRLLVYEYICNGSLDSHLYGRNQQTLEWSARQKIGLGAARGLRYLHEECRVGCIVHRDMRPNNILVTHDFEPLVGDFGLARWQPDGYMGVETRVLGTFGYLAPEYAQSGQITEKADVYSFGVVLVELITGRKAVDIDRPKGQQCLAEWARPLLAKYDIGKLIDPRLGNSYLESEIYNMMHCASLCIKRNTDSRPRMSQVLRILEGEMFMNSTNDTSPSVHTARDATSRMPPECMKQHHRHHNGPTPDETMTKRSLSRKHPTEQKGQLGGTGIGGIPRGRISHGKERPKD